MPIDFVSDEISMADKTIFSSIKYDNEIWNKISQEGFEFTTSLLRKDCCKRMYIKEALDHMWLKKYCNPSN